jgi:hypothetical protein
MATREARPPEWWTAENTAAWTREVWGDESGWSPSQEGWGKKIQIAVGRAGAACYRPLTAKELVEMRAKDNRPANPCYYDGTPILAYKPLVVKRGKKATV